VCPATAGSPLPILQSQGNGGGGCLPDGVGAEMVHLGSPAHIDIGRRLDAASEDLAPINELKVRVWHREGAKSPSVRVSSRVAEISTLTFSVCRLVPPTHGNVDGYDNAQLA
jgi:hypothetical protein